MICLKESEEQFAAIGKNLRCFYQLFPNFADRTEKSGPAVMADADRGLYLVFQIVLIWCLRRDEGIKCKLCAEAEAGDEAVEGGLTVDGCPGINILEETFLLLAGELIREKILAFVQRLHIVLHFFVLLGASRLRINIAVVKLFDKTIHGSFSLIFIEKPVRPCRKNIVFSMVFVRVLSGKFYPL